MRVGGGAFRGRRLATPRGRSVRPTSDRVREALFDVLRHGLRSVRPGPLPDGARVLDAFAGTGALGLEALSRGAGRVTFIEKDPAACRVIERNVRTLRVMERTALLRRNALRPATPPPGDAAADLLLMDPPYRSGLAAPALKALRARGWIARDGICVVEAAADDPLRPPRGFALVDERRHGDTALLFLTCEGPAAEASPSDGRKGVRCRRA